MTTLATIAYAATLDANDALRMDSGSPDLAVRTSAVDHALTLVSMVSSPVRRAWESAVDAADMDRAVELTGATARAALEDRAIVAALEALRAEVARVRGLSDAEAAAALSTAEYPVAIVEGT